MVDALPGIQSVYAKWEQRQPFRCREIPLQNGLNEPIENGRKAWQNKFGDNIQAPARRRRPRERLHACRSATNLTSSLGSFKVAPTIIPETNKYRRPFMGRTCSECVPISRDNFYKESMPTAGLRDVLRVPTEFRNNSIVTRSMCHIVYTFRRNPSQYVYPDVSQAVLTSPRLQEAITKMATREAAGAGETSKRFQKAFKNAKKKAKKVLSKMKAAISVRLIRFTGWFLLKALSRLLSTLQVHEGQMQMVKKASEHNIPMIYLPMHKSHLDYILLTFILYNYDIRAPHVAAGDNLDIPFFRSLMCGLGGFFIRRRLDESEGKKDYVYRAVLHMYMQEQLRHGQSLEFFMEGGRTRSGKALKPKGGLLSVVVESILEGVVSDAYIVPVSISYEKILDGNFNTEQMGNAKVKETFWSALTGIWQVFMSNYGSVRVDFAQPFSLQEYVHSVQGINRRLSSSPTSPTKGSTGSLKSMKRLCSSTSSLYGTDVVIEDQKQLVDMLAEHTIYNCVQTQAVMSTHMLSFLLLALYRDGVTLKRLVPAFDGLKEEIVRRGRDVGFVGKTFDVIMYACDLLGQHLIVTKESQKKCEVTAESNNNVLDLEIIPTVKLPDVFELFYYSNNVISVFALESVIASSICCECGIEFKTLHSQIGRNYGASKESVLSKATWLCTLLDFEFVFIPPCASLESELNEAMEKFVTAEILCPEDYSDSTNNSRERDWVHRLSKTVGWEEGDSDDDFLIPDTRYKVNTDWTTAMDKLSFLQAVLAPFIECYWVVSCQFVRLLKSDLPEADFVKDVQKVALERVGTGVAHYAESAANDSVKNAIKSFQRMKVTDIYVAAGIKMICLRDNYQTEHSIMELVTTLESYRQ